MSKVRSKSFEPCPGLFDLCFKFCFGLRGVLGLLSGFFVLDLYSSRFSYDVQCVPSPNPKCVVYPIDGIKRNSIPSVFAIGPTGGAFVQKGGHFIFGQ